MKDVLKGISMLVMLCVLFVWDFLQSLFGRRK